MAGRAANAGVVVALALAAAALAGCAGGKDGEPVRTIGPDGAPVVVPAGPGVALEGRGWLDDHDEWTYGERDGGWDVEALEDGALEAAPATSAAADLSAAASEAEAGAAPVPAADVAGAGGGEEMQAPQQQVGLRAGSVDDNERFEAYLEYRAQAEALGVAGRPFDPTGRLVVTVVGSDGRPVLGARVRLGDASDVMTTGADGQALLFRHAQDDIGVVQDDGVDQGQQQGGDQTDPPIAPEPTPVDVVVEYAGRTVSAAVGPTVPAITVNLQAASDVGASVPLDIEFVIDATGSMSDEIERLREEMIRVSRRIAELDAHPDVRFAMTVYRDRGDLFVTRSFDFTGDVEAFTRALSEVRADDGGDEPEDVESALAAALDKPEWRENAVKLAFLVADAPPHLDYADSTPYTESLAKARAAGVRIFPIASSGLNDTGELVFRELAQASMGRFVFLTYGADGATPGDETDHHVDDYSVLALDDLVVKLVEDELAPLAG